MNLTTAALANLPARHDKNDTPRQLTTGPAVVQKTKPTIAALATAMDDFAIRGMCRCIAYELLRYWQPGGTVFPSLTTLAESLGLKPRSVRYGLARLERVGLWVRHGRAGRTNTYELRLPGHLGNPLPGGAAIHCRGTPATHCRQK